ncbi:MAG TPA: PAS domain-containing protein, partial [Burkholderiaceae bacterium]|nr:PAS domain-containing protein [Burkholderiaceae bacterium]
MPSSADELELIYRTAPIGLAMVDRDLRFVRVNERLAQINGASIADHLGRTIGEMVPAVSEQAEAVVRRVLETGVPWTDVEIVGETPARPGERRVWREHWYPVHGSAGAIVGVSVVVEDVTERLDAERALRGLADDLG